MAELERKKEERLQIQRDNPELLDPELKFAPETNRRRPAEVYIPSWTGGAPAAFDLAVTSPQRQDILALASQRS